VQALGRIDAPNPAETRRPPARVRSCDAESACRPEAEANSGDALPKPGFFDEPVLFDAAEIAASPPTYAMPLADPLICVNSRRSSTRSETFMHGCDTLSARLREADEREGLSGPIGHCNAGFAWARGVKS